MDLNWDKFFCMVIYGTPGSGKTSLLKYIMWEASNHNRFNHCLLFSTNKNDVDYKFLPKKYKFDSYNKEAIENYVHFLRSHNEKKVTTKGCLLFDDVAGVETFKSAFFKQLLTNFRHWGVNIIICMQVPVEIPAYMRSIINYAAIYKYISTGDREKIYNAFGSLAPNKETFYNLYDEYTNQPYKFMFYNRTNMYDTKNAYSSMRAPDPKKYKFKIKLD